MLRLEGRKSVYRAKAARPRRAQNLIRRIALAVSLAGAGCAAQSVTPPAPSSAPTVAVQPPLRLCPPASVPPRELAAKPGYAQWTVYVTDQSDKPIAGLKQSDFAASADNQPLPIEFFRDNRGGVPLSLAMVLDTSGSMIYKLGITDPSKLQTIWNQMADVMAQLNECDEVATLQFGGRSPSASDYTWSSDARSDHGAVEIKLAEPLTTDHELALIRLTYVVPSGKTPLYDAIHEGLQTLAAGHYPDRAMIVITDGMDTASTRTEQAVLDEARQSGVAIYAIGVGNPKLPVIERNFVDWSGGIDHVNVDVLKDFSNATDGRTFVVSRLSRDTGAAFVGAQTRVAVILGQSYSIGLIVPPGNSAATENPTITVAGHPSLLVQAHRVIPIAGGGGPAAVTASTPNPR
jgi:VWFA-related protein